MPELPEVETIVRQLNRAVKGCTIKDVWSDWPKMFKGKISFSQAKKILLKKKILKVERKGKNILIYLSSGLICLVHLRMTGHFLVGRFKYEKEKWIPLTKGALNDPQNRFIHLLCRLDKKKMLALSDLRKFARVTILTKKDILQQRSLIATGIDPTSPDFNWRKLKEIVSPLKKKIKVILMDQHLISGIGNIYANEILWEAKINPWKEGKLLTDLEIKKIARAIRKILRAAINYQGSSVADDTYRMLNGRSGRYKPLLKVYQKDGSPCPRCGTTIKRAKIDGRSTFYCPHCQKL